MNVRPQLLSDLLGCEVKELTKHTKTVWEWRGVMYEVLTPKQVTSGRVSASHYLPIRYAGRAWRIRELGDKSKLYKEINND